MSLLGCFSKSKEDCKTPCVLEYQADTEDGNPTCVPPVQSLGPPKLSEAELVAIKQILLRLLPEVDSVELTNAFNTLHIPLFTVINKKIRDDVVSISHTTWRESCKRIADQIIKEIDDTHCFSCWESLNDKDSNKVITSMVCCQNVAHKECIEASIRHSGRCPWCSHVFFQQQLPVQQAQQAPQQLDTYIYTIILCIVVSFLLFPNTYAALGKLMVESGEGVVETVERALRKINEEDQL